MAEFNDSYLGQLRQIVGHRELIVPGVRAIIRDVDNRILLIHRKDTGRWGMPSGSIELNESIFECLVREVKEETGLIVKQATLIALYTHPRYSFTYPNKDKIKNFALTFRVDEWDGNLTLETDETSKAQFFPMDSLPDTHEQYIEAIEDFKNYSGSIIFK